MSDLTIRTENKFINKFTFIGLPPEYRAAVEAKTSPVGIDFLPAASLKGQIQHFNDLNSRALIIRKQFINSDVRQWLHREGVVFSVFDIEIRNSLPILRLLIDDYSHNQRIISLNWSKDVIDNLTCKLERERAERINLCQTASVPSPERFVFVINSGGANYKRLITYLRSLNPRAKIIGLVRNKNLEEARQIFDVALGDDKKNITISDASIAFVEEFEDLTSGILRFECVKKLHERASPEEIIASPPLFGENLSAELLRNIIPLINCSASELSEVFVPTKTMEGHRRIGLTDNVELTLSADVSAFANEKLVELIRRYPHGSVCYLNTSHHGIANIDAYRALRNAYDVRFVFYIHDLIPIEFSEYVRPEGADDHRRRMEAVAEAADLVLVNSEATKDSVTKWCTNAGRRIPPIEVTYIGVEEHFIQNKAHKTERRTLIEYDLSDGFSKKYFVYLGTIEPRKNHLLLLQAWRKMIAEGGDVPRLVLIGKRGWENGNVFAFLDQCTEIRQHVKEMNGLRDDILHRILHGSCAMLFPSFIEGWGMPIVEAQVMGVPVICSDSPVFREASQGLATFLDPLDGPAWINMIREFAKPESAVRFSAVERLESFAPPRWEMHFGHVQSLLRKVITP